MTTRWPRSPARSWSTTRTVSIRTTPSTSIAEGASWKIPADVPAATAARVQALAVETFRALDLAGLARVDFFLSRTDGALYVNEVNTIPGFTAVSMYPKMWEASGLPQKALLTRLIELAQQRWEARHAINTGRDANSPPKG